ncbi:MAG TPA: methyltransferase [Noviherbaspirillum sp.]|jgi:SAM-dependent methyltransferase|uniref:methyltransferase n=1 Tax=Noviherbaspirillum sp. TaxID=1926288 RepID=UPI002F927F4D
MAPEFTSRDPSQPQFWSDRFERKFTPWDRGGVPEAFRTFVAGAARPCATLIPGCGAGHEVALLAAAGWDVTAIDFSPAAVAAARQALGPLADRVQLADFFSFAPSTPPDLIYEQAFLCALPRDRWPAIVERWAHLLTPGGLLAGYFYFDNAEKGPPFGADPGQLRRMLAPHFAQVEDHAVTDSIPIFAGKERWQVWRRLPLADSAR